MANSRDTQKCILICDVDYALQEGTPEVKSCLRALDKIGAVIRPQIFDEWWRPRYPDDWLSEVFSRDMPANGWPTRSDLADRIFDECKDGLPDKPPPVHKDLRLIRGNGPVRRNARHPGQAPAPAFHRDGKPQSLEEVPDAEEAQPVDREQALVAFAALRQNLCKSTVGDVVSYAPPDRLWVQVYFNSIFSAVTFGAHLVDEGALLPDALVARIVTMAVRSVGGCWDAHGSDWVKAVFPDLAKDSDKRAGILNAWRDEDWVLAFLRRCPTSEAQTFGPVFLFSKRPGRMADALVILPLPVAADVAQLCVRVPNPCAESGTRQDAL